jgi:hypothetical protein
MCTELQPTSDERNYFSACGGSPVGMWRLVDMDFRGIPFALWETSQTTYCAVQTVFMKQPGGMLVLENGGTAGIRIDALERKASFRKDCATLPCSEYDADCTEYCGNCVCQGDVDAYASPSASSWTASGSYLVFTSSNTTLLEGDFCVQGNTMRLEAKDNGVFELERVFPMDASADCELLEWGRQAGCEVVAAGVCVGNTPACSGLTTPHCLMTPGCWVEKP